MGGGSQKTVEYQKTDPWAGQQPYLNEAFREASSIYNQQKGVMPQYDGEFVAQPTADQQALNQNTLNFANGAGAQNVSNTMGLGTAGAAAGFMGANAGMNGLFGLANTDYTGRNIDAAGQYAANPYMDGMVDAAMRDSRRQVSEQVMPGIDRAAAASGNLNNTGNDIQRGIVERGLAEKAGDISAQMRGQAYTNGLGISAQDNALRQQAMSQAGALGQGLYGTGLGGMQSAADMAQTNAVVGQLGSAGVTADNQAVLDNEMAKAEYKFNEPWAALQNYWGVVGDKSWGSEGYSVKKTSSQPSTMSTIGSIAGIMGSLFKCDTRTKHNIYFKTVIKGHRFYEFEYIGEDGKHFGPMAQEVETYMPSAIYEIDGIKHVNMNALLGA